MVESSLASVRQSPRRGLLVKRLILVVAAVITALFIVEIVLRIAGFTYFNPYVVDQDVGYSLRPNAEGWWTREAITYVKINSRGFRDREHEIAKPPDTFRIAILGDSFAEAFQVPLEKTFWSVIEQRVQECPRPGKPKVEVLNFGVSGFSTARELILLQTRVWQYSPDMIILLVTPANDIRDNSRTLSQYRNQPVPYFVFRDGKLVLDDSLLAERNRTLTFRLQKSFIGKSFNWLQSQLRILGLVYAFREARTSSQMSGDRNASDGGPLNEPGLASEIYRQTNKPEWEDAWRVTKALLVKMQDEARMKKARLLVVTGSAGIQVTPIPSARQEFMNTLGVSNLFYPEERIKSFGQTEGFAVLNLAPSLYEYVSTNGIFVHGSSESGGRGHWNELGHRLAGELISKKICE